MNPYPKTDWWRPAAVLAEGHRPALGGSRPKAADSAAPFWALMTFTFILLLAPQSYYPMLSDLRIAFLAAAAAVSMHVFHRVIHRRPVMTFTREMGIAACLAGWAIATVPLSEWPGGSFSFLLDVYFKSLVVFWLLSNVVNTLPRLKLVSWVLTLIAARLAVAGVRSFLSGTFIHEALREGVTRIVGYDSPLAKNPNDLAFILNLILPLSVGLLLGTQKPAVRWVLLAIIGLDVTGIIVTFSRAGFITLAVTFVTYLWTLLKRKRRGWALAALVLGLASVPLLPSGYVDRLSTITEIEADPTGSSQARWNDMVAAGKYVLRNPIIGAGVGMNVLGLNEIRGKGWIQVHNVYLEYAVDLGILGLVLFVMLLKGCLKSAGEVQRQSGQKPALKELFHLAEGIRVSLIAFAVAGFFHPEAYHFYFYYAAGLALAAKTVWHIEEKGLSFGATSMSPSREAP